MLGNSLNLANRLDDPTRFLCDLFSTMKKNRLELFTSAKCATSRGTSIAQITRGKA